MKKKSSYASHSASEYAVKYQQASLHKVMWCTTHISFFLLLLLLTFVYDLNQ